MSDFEDQVLSTLSRLEEGQTQLQTDVRRLEKGQTQLQTDVRRLEVLHEETSEKIDQIIEVVSPEMLKNNEQDLKLKDHEKRISSLELAIKV